MSTSKYSNPQIVNYYETISKPGFDIAQEAKNLGLQYVPDSPLDLARAAADVYGVSRTQLNEAVGNNVFLFDALLEQQRAATPTGGTRNDTLTGGTGGTTGGTGGTNTSTLLTSLQTQINTLQNQNSDFAELIHLDNLLNTLTPGSTEYLQALNNRNFLAQRLNVSARSASTVQQGQNQGNQIYGYLLNIFNAPKPANVSQQDWDKTIAKQLNNFGSTLGLDKAALASLITQQWNSDPNNKNNQKTIAQIQGFLDLGPANITTNFSDLKALLNPEGYQGDLKGGAGVDFKGSSGLREF